MQFTLVEGLESAKRAEMAGVDVSIYLRMAGKINIAVSTRHLFSSEFLGYKLHSISTSDSMVTYSVEVGETDFVSALLRDGARLSARYVMASGKDAALFVRSRHAMMAVDAGPSKVKAVMHPALVEAASPAFQENSPAEVEGLFHLGIECHLQDFLQSIGGYVNLTQLEVDNA